MEQEQSTAFRAVLHGWIDQATDKQLIQMVQDMHASMAGDMVAWTNAAQPPDRLAPETQIKAMMAHDVSG
jgi:hypothetical protein